MLGSIDEVEESETQQLQSEVKINGKELENGTHANAAASQA